MTETCGPYTTWIPFPLTNTPLLPVAFSDSWLTKVPSFTVTRRRVAQLSTSTKLSFPPNASMIFTALPSFTVFPVGVAANFSSLPGVLKIKFADQACECKVIQEEPSYSDWKN